MTADFMYASLWSFDHLSHSPAAGGGGAEGAADALADGAALGAALATGAALAASASLGAPAAELAALADGAGLLGCVADGCSPPHAPHRATDTRMLAKARWVMASPGMPRERSRLQA